MEWPGWWEWDVDCENTHLLKRMRERGFNEADLRAMLGEADGFHGPSVLGRFDVWTFYEGRRWLVTVEPDYEEKILVVVTAFPLE